MPKITVAGGPSNASDPNDPGRIRVVGVEEPQEAKGPQPARRGRRGRAAE